MLNVQLDRTCSEEVCELPARVAGAVVTVAPGQQTGDGAEEVEHDDGEGIPVTEIDIECDSFISVLRQIPPRRLDVIFEDITLMMNMSHMSNIVHHYHYNSFSLELRQGAGEEQEQQSNGAGEGEGHQG